MLTPKANKSLDSADDEYMFNWIYIRMPCTTMAARREV